MQNFSSITVERNQNNTVKVNNPTNYKLIGQGAQGAVFKLSPDRCIKIYACEKYAKREYNAYKAAEFSSIIPQMYEAGPNYMIMEYIDTLSLEDCCKERGSISLAETKLILRALREMERLGFTRIDCAARHIYITKQGKIKIIDLMNAYRIRQAVPKMLLGDLRRIGVLESFLDNVKKIDNSLYMEWMTAIHKKLNKYMEDK